MSPAAAGSPAAAVVADAYAALPDELRGTERTSEERALLADTVMYYGRFLDPRTHDYAMDSVVSNVARAIEHFGLPASRPMRILDIGCGLGMQSLIFARLGATVVGVDLDPRCTALAEKRRVAYEARWGMSLDASFVAADFHEFAARPHGAFDAVFSMSAFAHIPPLEATVAAIARLLAPDARVYLWDQNPDFLYLNGVRRSVAHLPRPRAIVHELARHGFVAPLVTGGGAIPHPFWRPPFVGMVAGVNRILRRSVRLSFNYVIAARRAGGTPLP